MDHLCVFRLGLNKNTEALPIVDFVGPLLCFLGVKGDSLPGNLVQLIKNGLSYFL